MSRSAGGGIRRGLGVAAAPPLAALLACASVPVAGFRWALALLIAAFAIQAGWDASGDALNPLIKQIRPIVTVGALLGLLVAFLGV